MSSQLGVAATDLTRREPPKVVAATGLLFRRLEELHESLTIGEVASARGGVWGSESAPGTGYPVLRSTNMRGARVDVDDPAWCDIAPSQAEAVSLLSGDILVTKSSGSTDLVGKAALFVQPSDGRTYLFSNFTLRLRPDRIRILPEYLAWFLRSPQGLQWRGNAQQNAVGLRNLQTKQYLAQLVPCPDPSVQRQVVTYLDAVESADGTASNMSLPYELDAERRIVARIEELAARIEQARGLRREAMAEADGLLDAARATVFARALSAGSTPLNAVARLERGRFSHRPRNEPMFFGGQHPWIQIAEIEASDRYIRHWTETLNDAGLSISRKFPKGTLLISIAATIGAVGILDFDCCVPDSIVGVTPNPGQSSLLLYHYLSYLRTHLQQVAPQSAQKNINLEILAPLPVPRLSLDEQREIADYLDSVQSKADALKQHQAATAVELEALLPSVLDRAFQREL